MNSLWMGLLVGSAVVAFFTGNAGTMVDSILGGAAGAVALMIELTGIYCLWMGMEKIADESGLVNDLAKFLGPLLRPLFPFLRDHPQPLSAIAASIISNVLGLSSGTPLGLKAMKEMKNLMPPDEDEAIDPMITLIVINAAGFCIFPSSVVALRAALGSANPSIVAGPTAIAGLVATAAGLAVDVALRRGRRK
ncbi:MAG: spore maturation protein [Firmicutes bacterium]|nr:spore maturation protein [Candidatus Fermentithermobacillaceae bacterium]